VLARAQLPAVLLGAGGVAVVLALGGLVWQIRRAPAAIEPGAVARAPSPAPAVTPDEPEEREAPVRPEERGHRRPPPSALAADVGERPSPPTPAEPTGDVLGIPTPEDGPPAKLSLELRAAVERYDRGDYEAAAEKALVVLAESPDNVRALRILVSSSCMTEQEARAREYYAKLPERDQAQIAKRCSKFGVEF
jgi:hypothetical protein